MTHDAPPTLGSDRAHAPRSTAVWRSLAAEYLSLIGVLVLLVVFFSLKTDHFFGRATFLTMANQVPAVLLLATGMTYVLIIAQIDLSVGSVLGFSGAVLGVLLERAGWPVVPAVLATLLVGLLCGGFNGWVSVRWRLPSFIVTLGMLEMARGGAHAVTHSQTQYVGSALAFVVERQLLGLSVPFLLVMVIVLAAQVTLTRTILGRTMIAIGTNEEAVRLSGINPNPIKIAVFMITGVLVALGAVIDTARMGSADPNAGTGFELQAIAAAVIGGTSLMGGRGSVIGTTLGVLIIVVLEWGLAAMGARDETKRLVTGAVIVLAVILDQYRHRFSHRLAS